MTVSSGANDARHEEPARHHDAVRPDREREVEDEEGHEHLAVGESSVFILMAPPCTFSKVFQ